MSDKEVQNQNVEIRTFVIIQTMITKLFYIQIVFFQLLNQIFISLFLSHINFGICGYHIPHDPEHLMDAVIPGH